ncbi:glycoside hydrolase superfamily [Thelonectria olida]|uniref:Glycoside hydrolase superfamily n=1 Tax=Thelonectria olida TaxID=1576542 RepID=A0A9P9AJW6_9HYPO|nr:glycoside hydrolase superfamily [Thelonectria olida]
MAANSEGQHPAHPHLRRDKDGSRLIVKDKPFLMLAGELHNPSLSSARYMAGLWPVMKKQGINTLLGCVSWEQIEPVEGRFNFSELDKHIRPSMGEAGLEAFPPRTEHRGGRHNLDMITPLSTECAEADAKAFGKLLAHIEDFDAEYSTVIMVQVENESGMLGGSRIGPP